LFEAAMQRLRQVHYLANLCAGSLIRENSPHTSDLISLKDAGIPGGALVVRDLDEVHVQRLVNSDVARWPAIKVTATTRGYLLIDGYHRQEAAIRKGESLIPAVIGRYASLEDVIEAAFRANLFHSKQASEKTRSDYAYWLHCTYQQMSQEEIAIWFDILTNKKI
jgi:hypothetical protein